jgi:hypothetical protein
MLCAVREICRGGFQTRPASADTGRPSFIGWTPRRHPLDAAALGASCHTVMAQPTSVMNAGFIPSDFSYQETMTPPLPA